MLPENSGRSTTGHHFTIVRAGAEIARSIMAAIIRIVPTEERYAIDRAWNSALERIELEVVASNEPAVGLYRKMGFVTEGVKRHGRKLDGVYDDIIVMALSRQDSGRQSGRSISPQ